VSECEPQASRKQNRADNSKKDCGTLGVSLLIYTCNSGVRPVYTNNNGEPLPLYRIGGILNLSKAVRYETQASHGLRLLGMKLRH
jgi:hypothetical protein